MKAASDEGVIPESTTVPDSFSEEAGLAWIERQHSRVVEGQGWRRARVARLDTDTVGGAGARDHTWQDVAGQFETERDQARHERDLLAEALGSLLVRLGAVEDVPLTGPQLLATAQGVSGPPGGGTDVRG